MSEQSDKASSVKGHAGFRARFFTGTPASGRPTVPFSGRPPTGPTPSVPLTGNAPPLPPSTFTEEMPFAGRPVSAPPACTRSPGNPPPRVSFANEPTEQLPVITAAPGQRRPPPPRAAGRVVLIYEQQIRKPWRLLLCTASIVSLTVGVVLGQTEAYRTPTPRSTAAAQPSDVVQTVTPLTAPLSTITQRRLEIAGPATTLRIRTADLGESLYNIAPLDPSSSVQMTETGDGTQLTLVPAATGTAGAEVVLSSKVRWTLKLTGGTAELDVDSRAGGLIGAELVAGVSRGVLRLPEPKGTVPISVTGAVGELTVRTEAHAPVRVRLGKGAGLATVGGKARRGVKAGTTLRDAGWAKATNRYDVRVTADVSTLLVERIPATD
ncbi:hypothetical protein [Actinoplanes awajinensis]|uniref:Uncharacterized protein n=1 Tax=Actinoplanes awajinensis subsp. mycoplanecinus TaxID=135947 RepID=A0A101JFI2_9ACTN|nr:hypothetical protein [Actinoplanes awajinensis]KUL25880.1 hypothetical protein ADL15_39950 [Actinoplanes awajinensis subsp. mycoplanecinus]